MARKLKPYLVELNIKDTKKFDRIAKRAGQARQYRLRLLMERDIKNDEKRKAAK